MINEVKLTSTSGKIQKVDRIYDVYIVGTFSALATFTNVTTIILHVTASPKRHHSMAITAYHQLQDD